MIPSPWVYHGLNFMSTLSGEVQIKERINNEYKRIIRNNKEIINNK